MQVLVEIPDSQRDRAIRADKLSTDGVSLAELWWQLTEGRLKLLDWFLTSTRCLVLFSAQQPPRRPLDVRALDAFESVLLGNPQKCVALDSHVALSTIATRCKDAMRWFATR